MQRLTESGGSMARPRHEPSWAHVEAGMYGALVKKAYAGAVNEYIHIHITMSTVKQSLPLALFFPCGSRQILTSFWALLLFLCFEQTLCLPIT